MSMDPMSGGKPVPPVPDRIEHVHHLHGHRREDPYYWLRERDNPAVTDYLNRENAYTEAVLQPVAALREKLFGEMKSRLVEDDSTVPYRLNGFEYYTRHESGREYPVHCRRRGEGAPEEILLDVNELAAGSDYFRVSGREVSDDNRLLAYGEDRLGRRLYTLRVKDLETGELLPDTVEHTGGSVAWAAGNRCFYYAQKDPGTLRTWRIMRHRLGTDSSQDEVVFEEPDTAFHCGVFRSRSRRFVMIYSVSTLTSEYLYLEAGDTTGRAKPVLPRKPGVLYEASHLGDRFFLRTNAGGAINFKLVAVPLSDRGVEEEILPHRPDTLLEDILPQEGFLIVAERNRGIGNLRVIPWGNPEGGFTVPTDDEAHGIWFAQNYETDSRLLRYSYTSLTTPMSVYDLDLDTRERTLLKEQRVPGGFNKADYASERLFVRVRDGAEVPVSLVYRCDARSGGPGPLLLYGYGSYGHSIDPYFSTTRLSLLDRGFTYAIAHVRGGEEMGRPWYESGKLMNKLNTFHDFIDCAEHLVHQGYAAPDKLFAMGGSAGGLLMGAIINMRPDLWRGVVAAVPFVDVVTTMLDESIPLTTFEYDEWGNPNREDFYRYMLSYSPYDNVGYQAYPNLLVTAGLHDSQVQYWEPAKWVARLRERKKGDSQVLLHTDMSAGHSGASGRYEQFRTVALEYAFLCFLLGIAE